jgi:hypothetical protein
VHQIESLVAMLRQKFRSQQRYWMDFNKWEHFVNDDCTRSFLSLEVTSTGLPEISKQITMVDDVYRLHGLPEFYKVIYSLAMFVLVFCIFYLMGTTSHIFYGLISKHASNIIAT